MQNIKKCPDCNKFFDYTNNNFSMNLAISEFLQEEDCNKDLLMSIHKNIERMTKIQWCLCKNDFKFNFLAEAEMQLHFDISESEKPISNGNIDFGLNENIAYTKAGKFNEGVFLNYLKSFKVQNEHTDLSFDFLTYEKMNTDEFVKKNYKNYFFKFNYVLITDLHMFKENQIEEYKVLISILKERLSNGKITFLLLNENFEKFSEIVKGNNWASNAHIYNELLDLIKKNYIFKKVAVETVNDLPKITTLDFEVVKKNSKKVNKEEKKLEEKSSNLGGDFD